MSISRQAVSSSYCRAVGYDAPTKEMHVEWNNGRVSVYADVSEAEYNAVLNAASVGKAVIQIKKVKAHHYL
jgi:hypothetical protein